MSRTWTVAIPDRFSLVHRMEETMMTETMTTTMTAAAAATTHRAAPAAATAAATTPILLVQHYRMRWLLPIGVSLCRNSLVLLAHCAVEHRRRTPPVHRHQP
jgi:hypothetical protein